ncbi:patatin-like phospholipase family protein [Candidatus Igneacidithiobacillus taiwanensis]|uniref:patatin-like phospholipase family protein n=1 Tax=Candidatus Igneacidithiobacillus taiwanensis TaxID=1945924 RepID=UPI00289B1926|nr:patatin-like phospholipase family protein [Candidatus Igneacidithiobacillus taiwanensis]
MSSPKKPAPVEASTTTPLKPIQVCFSGGGTLAPLHVGAILALEEAGYTIVDPSGASAGAIVSACIALDMSGKDMEQIVLDADFKHLIPIRYWTYSFRGYAASIANARSWLREITNDLTLQECKTSLTTVTSDEETQRTVPLGTYFSDPDTPVWQVVLPSFSIPEIFPPYKGRYCDGGVMMNLPIEYTTSPYKKLALRITERSRTGPITGWLDRQERLLDMMLTASERASVALAKAKNIPVLDLPAGNAGFLDTSMTISEKRLLVRKGESIVKAFLGSEAEKERTR